MKSQEEAAVALIFRYGPQLPKTASCHQSSNAESNGIHTLFSFVNIFFWHIMRKLLMQESGGKKREKKKNSVLWSFTPLRVFFFCIIALKSKLLKNSKEPKIICENIAYLYDMHLIKKKNFISPTLLKDTRKCCRWLWRSQLSAGERHR